MCVCVQWLPILPCELITSNYFELPHMKCPDCSDNQIGAISKQAILCYTIMNYHEIQWFYIYTVYIYIYMILRSLCSLLVPTVWVWATVVCGSHSLDLGPSGLRDGWWMLMNKMPTHGRIPVLICINWIQLVHDQPKKSPFMSNPWSWFPKSWHVL